jgi:hypothetical protein
MSPVAIGFDVESDVKLFYTALTDAVKAVACPEQSENPH